MFSLGDILAIISFIAALVLLGYLIGHRAGKLAEYGPAAAGRLWTRLWCGVRQLLRRWNWAYLFLLGLLAYPTQIYWQARRAAEGLAGEDRVAALAKSLAKVVDPDQVYSKMSLAVGVFCLINFLGWAALNLAIDVITNWAKGDYADAERAAAVGLAAPVVGFKRTFLGLEPLPRIVVYFLFFALEIYAASAAVEHAFKIQ